MLRLCWDCNAHHTTIAARCRVVGGLLRRYRIVIELLSHSNHIVIAQWSHRTMQKSCYATQPIVNLTVTVVNVNHDIVIDINANYRYNVNINTTTNTIINTNTAEY